MLQRHFWKPVRGILARVPLPQSLDCPPLTFRGEQRLCKSNGTEFSVGFSRYIYSLSWTKHVLETLAEIQRWMPLSGKDQNLTQWSKIETNNMETSLLPPLEGSPEAPASEFLTREAILKGTNDPRSSTVKYYNQKPPQGETELRLHFHFMQPSGCECDLSVLDKTWFKLPWG